MRQNGDMGLVKHIGGMAGLVMLALAGCAQFPELEAGETPGVAEAQYPRLVPLEQLLTGPEPTATVEVVARVEGRSSGLRARAARLRAVRVGPGPGIDRRVARLRQKAAELRAQ